MLRTLVETDLHHYKRWQPQGEWRLLDAPWAQNVTEEKKDKESRKKQTNIQDDSVPQQRAVIATIENKPLGWVNRCVIKNSQLVWFVGIDICEDDYLNCGYGTEALKLWVKHLFANSEYHIQKMLMVRDPFSPINSKPPIGGFF